jgi:hypothetical protein
MSGRNWGAIALFAVAALMLLGFARSNASLSSPTAIVALLITVGLPAAGGFVLMRGGFGGGGNSARVERLRQQTIEAEILKMAMQQKGKLTAVEVATALALPPESAKASLDALVTREVADLEITDAGVLVYTFHDAKHAGGKDSSRGLLDAG